MPNLPGRASRYLSGREPGSMNRPSRIDDARIDEPAFFINLWKMQLFVT